MKRSEFLKNIAVFGAASPFLSMLMSSCSKDDPFFNNVDVNFDGKVIVVGAGSAGLMAGYILHKQGIDFEILEASSVHGGRIKKIEGFADFPIDLGAEWIHTEPTILSDLINDPSVEANIETIVYSPEEIYLWDNNKLKKRNFFSNFYSEYKFKRSTWFDFFEDFIVPNFSDRINYNTPISLVDYSSDQVVLTDINGVQYIADKVLITVPLTILKGGQLEFTPGLPGDKLEALDNVEMPDGLKVFMEFTEKFYPDLLNVGGLGELLGSSDGERIYYDAAFRKESDRNILALFSVGDVAGEYTNLANDEAIINAILTELDQMYDGKASATLLNYVVQNWSKEPYIQGSYSHYQQAYGASIDALLRPVNDKVYFAGEAMSYESSSTVHGAAETAYTQLEKLLATP